jgi:hypothetical protein
LNKKGQFSIIAALLVAVILVATVVVTYSTIRNNPIQDQPQVLSAIDETNLALKQILGFTIGYYGSVLQVTGNSSYARMLATNYLHSGLINIASMHPEWGTSFNLSQTDMHTYWFANVSYSMGNLVVNYSLTGLGIYGITYETSSKLTAQVNEISEDNQTQLVIIKDDSEPLINLGRHNFKFYRFIDSDSRWELISPSTEPTAYANGTYIIDIPSGVDPYSYFVQVEDSRGIIVVASSFSSYICTLSWSQRSLAKYAVAGSTPPIIGAPDGNYATLGKDATCTVTDYQGGTGTIKKVYFNITYYGTVSGSLEWAYRLDGGAWNIIGSLSEGGSAGSPLKATYNATSLRPSWTWTNLNTTDIQFHNYDDGASEDAYVDAMYVTVVVEVAGNYSTIPDESIVVELLQNGAMRWLGQDIEITTQAKPIPPMPVKAIHVNQTINGVNREVPFQIEDWASEYRIPLGLSNNASVLSSRTMLVFLANSKASKITIWWNGSDTAKQTPFAYVNRYFTNDDPDRGILTNNRIAVITQSSYLYVDNFDLTYTSWAEFGTSPYLNDDTTNYIRHSTNNGREGWFTLENLTPAQVLAAPAIKSLRMEFECRRDGNDDYFDFRINDGTTIYGPYTITPTGEYQWRTYDISSIITDWTKINNLRIDVRYRQQGGSASYVYVRRCRLSIDFGGWLTAVAGNAVTEADFLRINNEYPIYGAEAAIVIHHGIIRDIVQQEAEWSGGIASSPNVYSQIVLTLPANASFYTYSLRTMFINSAQARTVSDLCPIRLAVSTGVPKTENGTSNGLPIVASSTGTFYNFSTAKWAHHWTQFISGTRGAGIMFTDSANQMLYVFDPIAGSKTGAIRISNSSGRVIELLPVAIAQAPFTYALDVTWHGAVVMFDGTKPIYKDESGQKTGLWITVEYPPIIAVTTDS